MKVLQVCLPHLSDVATLPWEIQKSYFQQYYSCILLIICVISHAHTRTYTHAHTRLMALMLFQKKTNCNPLAHPTWKCHHTNFWIAKLFFYLTEGLLHSFKHRRLWREPVVDCHLLLWKEPVVMCGNWNVRQAMSQQVFRVTTFCVNTCFQSFSTLFSHVVHHAVLKFN